MVRSDIYLQITANSTCFLHVLQIFFIEDQSIMIPDFFFLYILQVEGGLLKLDAWLDCCCRGSMCVFVSVCVHASVCAYTCIYTCTRTVLLMYSSCCCESVKLLPNFSCSWVNKGVSQIGVWWYLCEGLGWLERPESMIAWSVYRWTHLDIQSVMGYWRQTRKI